MAKVLLVEDDQLLVRLYTKKLTKESFEVVVANDGKEGLGKATSEKPDLILLDLMMPGMDGLETLEKLQADAQLKTIPVIILTNVSSETDEAKTKSLGAIDYLVKANNPPDAVITRVQEVLNG